MRLAPPGKHSQLSELAGDEGFLLGTTPSLHLPFRGDCILNPIEFLVESK